MTKFNAQAYASGLTVATFNADLDAGTITKAQAKATVAAKLSRDSMKPSARKRWTRVADMLETAGTINTHVAFRGAQADAKAAVKAVKAHVAKRKLVLPVERMNALVSKRIMSKDERAELSDLIAAYVTR